jgi:hypothetical protein
MAASVDDDDDDDDGGEIIPREPTARKKNMGEMMARLARERDAALGRRRKRAIASDAFLFLFLSLLPGAG